MNLSRANLGSVVLIAVLGCFIVDAPICLGALSIRDDFSLLAGNAAHSPALSGASAAPSSSLNADSVSVLPGDTNFDRTVSFVDLNTLLSQYAQSGTWSTGDFNADGQVTFADLNVLLSNYGKSLPPSVEPAPAIVPEPVSLVVWSTLAGVASAGAVAKRRRRGSSGRWSNENRAAILAITQRSLR